jgi:diguanylate cyclase (GGDEF)-like protein
MMSLLGGLLLLGLLGAGAWILLSGGGRSAPPAPAQSAEGPPLLDWLLRANGALGAWLVGPGSRETAGPTGGLPVDLDRVVQGRLEQHRLGDAQGVERLEGGTLVYASLDGRAAGLLLPARCSSGARGTALRDLARLLDFDRWRPVLADVARQQERPDESVESIALRLAHQLERLLGVETCVAVTRATGVEVAGVSFRSDRRLLRTVVEEGSPLDLVARGEAGPLTGAELPMGAAVPDRRQRRERTWVVPLPGDSGPIGAVALWTAGGLEPGGPELAGFRNAILAAASRLQAALAHQALAQRAIRDPLTGLLNRRGLEDAMTSLSAPEGALVYADLDRFKALNDELGHPAGDAALLHFSRLLVKAVRGDDVAARIGGEEFAVWLPGASLERGRQVAERIRQALVYSDWRWQGEARGLSASFGVAACPETASTREGLPVQADAALYEAKRRGRDRVVTAG